MNYNGQEENQTVMGETTNDGLEILLNAFSPKEAFAIAFDLQQKIERDMSNVLRIIKDLAQRSIEESDTVYIKLSEMQLNFAKGGEFDRAKILELLFPSDPFPNAEKLIPSQVKAAGAPQKPMSIQEFNLRYADYNDSANAIKKEIPEEMPDRQDATSSMDLLYKAMGIRASDVTRSPYEPRKNS